MPFAAETLAALTAGLIARLSRATMDPRSCPWDGYQPAVIDLCEDQPCSWIVEPANAWSCLAYVVVGAWLVRRALRDRASALVPIGVSAILVGLLSFGLHASMTLAWEFLDFASMTTFSAYALVATWRRYRRGARLLPIGLYVAIVTATLASLAVVRQSGAFLFGGQVVATLVLELRMWLRSAPGAAPSYRYLQLLLAFFVMALIAWVLDFSRVWCDPANHWLQGHALWHVLNSSCFYWYYRYCRQFDFGGGDVRAVGPL